MKAVNDRLSGYEKEFHDNVEARAQQVPADYRSADYMDEYAHVHGSRFHEGRAGGQATRRRAQGH